MFNLPLRYSESPSLARGRPWKRPFSSIRWRSIGWEAIVVYTLVAVVLGRHTVAHMATGCSCSNIPDSWEATWPFAWFPYALTHGLNPWYTHAMWSPPGFNVAGITSFPLPAMVLAPVTWLWGPLVSANVANLGAPVATGWATYHLCRYVSKDRMAALVGGVTVGFGTYVLLQMSASHIVVTIIIGPQFAAIAVLRYLDGAIGRRRVIAELTLCLIIQLFSSSEVFFTMTVFGAVLLVLGYAFGTRELRAGLRKLIVPILIAYGLTAVVSADYLYWILKAPKYAIGIGEGWTTDLLSYVVPTTKTWIGGSSFSSVYGLFDGGAESDAYLGLPLLLITARWICTHWQLRVSRFLAAAFAVSVLWTLGGTLHLAGKPTIWLPYRLIAGLPLFNEVLQSRTAFYTELLTAVTLTLWLADRRERQGSRHRPFVKWIAGLTAAFFVFPNLVDINVGYESTRLTPAFFASDMYRNYIKPGARVFTINWGYTSPSLIWQAQDDMYYQLAGGYFTPNPPPDWEVSPTINDLWFNTPQPGDGAGLRSILIQRHVDDVVITPIALAQWQQVVRAAGLRRPVYVGGIYLYRKPW
jgi:hypothetical protein